MKSLKPLVFVWMVLGAPLAEPPQSYAYPERPLKLIIPWPAGGDTDIILRIVANGVQKHLGQPVVPTNIGGASGTKGAAEARKSPPDGYTIYAVHDYIHTTHYTGVSDINYWDFEPICLATSTQSILTASPKTPWKNFKEMVEDAKKRPEQIAVGVTLGSRTHFFPAWIANEAKIKFKYVSYEGTAQRTTALLGGHVDMGESNLTQHDKVKAGQLKFLAISAEKRHPEVPDVPTLKEVGVNVVYPTNRGLMAPKGTPEAVLAKLEDACAKATKDPEFAAQMQKQATDVYFLGRREFARFQKELDDKTKSLAVDLGLLKTKK